MCGLPPLSTSPGYIDSLNNGFKVRPLVRTLSIKCFSTVVVESGCCSTMSDSGTQANSINST